MHLWRIWKEAEEKILRECGIDEATIEQIRTDNRADFNSNRRFYRCQTRRGGWRNSGAGGRRKKSTWLLC